LSKIVHRTAHLSEVRALHRIYFTTRHILAWAKERGRNLRGVSVTREGSECIYKMLSDLTYRCIGLVIPPSISFPRNAAPNPEDDNNTVRKYTGHR